MKLPRPIPNWRRVALRSHSMWAGYLGLLALILPELILWLFDYDVASPRLWWFTGIGLIAYGLAGRLIDQGLSR